VAARIWADRLENARGGKAMAGELTLLRSQDKEVPHDSRTTDASWLSELPAGGSYSYNRRLTVTILPAPIACVKGIYRRLRTEAAD
jgi:hypothetical protein